MAKAKTAYLCTECGAHSVKWAGQCPDCASWNTLTATTISTQKISTGPSVAATTLDALPDDIEARYLTGFGEFDRVLGGGLVPGAVVPGLGKPPTEKRKKEAALEAVLRKSSLDPFACMALAAGGSSTAVISPKNSRSYCARRACLGIRWFEGTGAPRRRRWCRW